MSFSFGSDQTLTPMLLSGSHDETVKVWNVKDFEKLEETLLFSTVLSAVSPVSQPNSLIAVLGRSDNHLQVMTQKISPRPLIMCSA